MDIQPVDEAVDLGADIDDAYQFVCELGLVKGLTDGLDRPAKSRALDRLLATIAAHHTADGVLFASSAWLIIAQRP
jgi:hypothetical protein